VLKSILTIAGSGFGTDPALLDVKLIRDSDKKEVNCFVTATTAIEITCSLVGGSVGAYTP
jgi:hypothetical protein